MNPNPNPPRGRGNDMKTEDTEEYKLTYDDSETAKDAAFSMLLAFFKEHRAFHGESIFQRDAPQIEAPGLLSDIAEKVFKFEQSWKE